MKSLSLILVLIGGLILFAAPACMNSADPLDGTAWNLTAYSGEPLIPETTVTIEFTDGRVSGSAGCNSYGGTYQIDGRNLQIDELVSTLMACPLPEGVMEQEAAVLNGLLNAASFRLQDDQLEITASGGETLTFTHQ